MQSLIVMIFIYTWKIHEQSNDVRTRYSIQWLRVIYRGDSSSRPYIIIEYCLTVYYDVFVKSNTYHVYGILVPNIYRSLPYNIRTYYCEIIRRLSGRKKDTTATTFSDWFLRATCTRVIMYFWSRRAWCAGGVCGWRGGRAVSRQILWVARGLEWRTGVARRWRWDGDRDLGKNNRDCVNKR